MPIAWQKKEVANSKEPWRKLRTAKKHLRGDGRVFRGWNDVKEGKGKQATRTRKWVRGRLADDLMMWIDELRECLEDPFTFERIGQKAGMRTGSTR